MTTPLEKNNPACQACLDEGVRQASVLIQQWCSRLLDALSARSLTISAGAEKHPVNHAVVALMRNRMLMAQDFIVELKQAMSDDALLIAPPKTGKPLRALSTLKFDDLELMGDHQVQETVERARLQEVVRLTCGAALSGFSARLSTVQGFEMVKADRNPLRPDIVLQALLKVLEALPVSSEVRFCLLAEGAQLMGDELQSLYLAMDAFLVKQGVAPAAYGVISAPESQSGKAAQAPQAPDAAYATKAYGLQGDLPPTLRTAIDAGSIAPPEAMTLANRKKLLTLDHLRHLLAGDYDAFKEGNADFSSPSPEGRLSDFSHTLPAAFDVLLELKEKASNAGKKGKDRPTPPPPVAQLRAHLKIESRTLGQSLAVEVVGLMIEQITQDERLLEPVRQVIANAESAFLRLATRDTRFFSDKTHPGRKLLDTITSTSLAYASEAAPGFAGFMKNLRLMALSLTQADACDAPHFAALLQEFERQQARSTPEYRQSELRAVQALLQVEQRNLLADKIAADIRRRPGFQGISPAISGFLTGPWTQVMARERLLAQEGNAEAQKGIFNRVPGTLLWSVDPAQTAGQRQPLLQLIPVLLKSLRDGLVSIDYPLDQAKDFFHELMTLHQAGLRAPAEVPPGAPAPTSAPAPAPAPVMPSRQVPDKMFESDARPRAPRWLAPAEAENSGFMEDWEASIYADEQPASAPSAAAPSAADAVLEWQEGVWVEMLVDTQWLRAQLSWISPQRTLYMFTSEGGRKHSMTNRVLHHLLALGFVKVISDQGVLERALNSVARTAMRNSLEDKSGF
jgi:hypothetical protein